MTTENQNINSNSAPELDENGFIKTVAPVVDSQSIESGNTPPNDETPKPKKRGRPSNADKARMEAEQIESGGATPKSAASKPRKQKASYSEADIGLMAKQLVGLHQIAAMATGIPEIQIAEHEAALLAAAIVNVSTQYDLAIDGKTGALIQMVGVAAMIYVPRLGAVSKRAKEAKAARNVARTVESPAN